MNTKTISIVGLVLSFVFPVAGIIVSAICLKKYKNEGVTDGKSFATAGLVIGIVLTVLGIVGSIIFMTFFSALFNEMLAWFLNPGRSMTMSLQ